MEKMTLNETSWLDLAVLNAAIGRYTLTEKYVKNWRAEGGYADHHLNHFFQKLAFTDPPNSVLRSLKSTLYEGTREPVVPVLQDADVAAIWRALEDKDMASARKLSAQALEQDPTNDDAHELNLLIGRLSGKYNDAGLADAISWMERCAFSERSVCTYLLISRDTDCRFIRKFKSGEIRIHEQAVRMIQFRQTYDNREIKLLEFSEEFEHFYYLKCLSLNLYIEWAIGPANAQGFNNSRGYEYLQTELETTHDQPLTPILHQYRAHAAFVGSILLGLNLTDEKYGTVLFGEYSYADPILRSAAFLRTDEHRLLLEIDTRIGMRSIDAALNDWQSMLGYKMKPEMFLLEHAESLFHYYIRIASRERDFIASEELVKRTIRLHGESHHTVSGVAWTFSNAKMYSAAQQMFEHSLKLVPDCDGCRLGLAGVKRSKGDLKAARNLLIPTVRRCAAIVHNNEMDEDVRLAHEIHPEGHFERRQDSSFLTLCYATLELGLVYMLLKQWQLAEKHLRLASELRQSNIQTWEFLNEVYQELGNELGQKKCGEMISALSLKRRKTKVIVDAIDETISSPIDFYRIAGDILELVG
ncbi:MAG: hypothetical protein NXH87_17940 [Rhodobiaceae bacterium]|nr:hypothetical protein [Rhodobiaceae bacterium]